MELIKKNIHMEHRINRASTQISLEEDVNISDQKPDAYKVICKNTYVKVDEVKPIESAVWMKGALCYCILYLTDEKERRICGMEGSVPFEEKVYTNDNVTGDSLRIHAGVEDLSVRLINSRKINIRSVIDINVKQDELFDEEVVVDVENPQTCEILKKNMDVTSIMLDTKDIYRIREEIMVPEGLPNIYNVIWKDVCINGMNFTVMDGKIGISGELNAFFLYEGEEDTDEIRHFEVSRPFSGVLEVPDCKENMMLQMNYEVEPVHMETKTDYDGEERQIDLDTEIKLYIKLYQSTTLQVVADAYGIQEKVTPVMKESRCEKIVKRECGKIKINETWENAERVDGNSELLHTQAFVLEEESFVKDNEIELSGIVHVEMLCRSEDENEPFGVIEADIPYEHIIGENGVESACSCVAKVSIDQINAVMQGGRIEIRIVLTYGLMVYRVVEEPLLSEMKKDENETEERALPVMSVYFAKENEMIWEVGKKYQVPLGNIREINQLTGDTLQNGQKVLVVKEVV